MCRVSAPTRCISAASRLCSVSRLGRRLLAALRRMLAETGRTRRCASESHGGSRRRRQSPREPYAGVRAFARAAATACLGQRGNDGRNTNPSPPKFEARRNNDRETAQDALTEGRTKAQQALFAGALGSPIPFVGCKVWSKQNSAEAFERYGK